MLQANDQYIALNDVYLLNGMIKGFIKGNVYTVNHHYKLVGEKGCLIWREASNTDDFDENFELFEQPNPMLKHLEKIEDDVNTEDSYESRVDKIFGNGSIYKHRTLRTVFDPFSKEWDDTSIKEKINILDTIIKSGEHLELLVTEYKFRYIQQNRRDIAKSLETALLKILPY